MQVDALYVPGTKRSLAGELTVKGCLSGSWRIAQFDILLFLGHTQLAFDYEKNDDDEYPDSHHADGRGQVFARREQVPIVVLPRP